LREKQNKMQELTKNSILVKECESGMRLDRLLALKFPVINRDEWQNRILSGMVLVNSKKSKPSRKIHAEEKIEFFYRRKDEPDVDFNVKILHEDDSLLVLEKPANLPVHPSGIYHKNTLHGYLKEKYGNEFVPRFAHRLDRETSGILILTKSSSAAANIQKSFFKGDIYKEYLVFAEGIFPEYKNAEGVLVQDNKSIIRKKRKFIFCEPSNEIANSETARTEFFREFAFKNISLLRVLLHTGRTHQIRATLCSLGFPVVGDRLYGLDDNLYLKLISGESSEEDLIILKINRTALHCSVMEFHHPVNGEKIRIESKLPEDMQRFLDSLQNEL
jgi:23S rRNA pseudouridine955/2504/2580 synthase/23S rRNA pseudouridine1911/1915/1917 synthase